jgi:hypothetical protein
MSSGPIAATLIYACRGRHRGATDAYTGEGGLTLGRLPGADIPYTPTQATVMAHHTEHTRDTGGHYAHARPKSQAGGHYAHTGQVLLTWSLAYPPGSPPICLSADGRLPGAAIRPRRQTVTVCHAHATPGANAPTPAQVPAGGEHAHTSKKCGSRRHSRPAAVVIRDLPCHIRFRT